MKPISDKDYEKYEKLAEILKTLVLVFVIILGSSYVYISQLRTQANTEKAEKLIQGGKYDKAIEFLELNKRTAYDEDLVVYAKAKKMAEGYDVSTKEVYFLLKDTDFDDGNLTEDMSTMRKKYAEKYDAELKAEVKAKEDQRLAELKRILPYVGMSTDDISNTMVCRYNSVHTEKQSYGHKLHYNTEYIWKDKSKKYDTLIVWAYDGKVTKVVKYYEDVFWTASGKPNFGASDAKIVEQKKKAKAIRDSMSSGKAGYSGKSSYSGNRSYDVDDYDRPEDFADDAWGDEFDDWDDAYDYWEDNY